MRGSVFRAEVMYNLKGLRRTLRKVACWSQHSLSDSVSAGIRIACCLFRGSILDAGWHVGDRL